MEKTQLKVLCEEILRKQVESIKSIPGGDINHSYQIETNEEFYFCKVNNEDFGEDLLQQEAHALDTLSRHCKVPDRIGTSKNILVLSWLISSKKSKRFWEDLAQGLVSIHKITSNKFGFDRDNYIGTLAQSNAQRDSWSTFYVSQRLMPQLKLAVDKGLLTINDFGSEEFIEKIVKVVCPEEPAALIHGDLWSGNIICNENGEAYFIDPSLSYAHREMDIAMSMLFGKFDDHFYEVYNELRPLEKSYKDRLDIYQLYYLLAHLNMFGLGYKNDVLKIINRYFK